MIEYSFERVKKFVAGHTWNFASSMSYIPHWYCLRNEFNNVREFTAFVRFIRSKSRDGQFGSRKFRYFYLNGYKYWDMDDTPESCDLVNRDKYKRNFIDKSPFVAVENDMYLSIRRAEDIEFVKSKLPKLAGSVVNVGCGEGVLLDIFPDIKAYAGVDIRENYVREAFRRHPNRKFYVDSIKNLHLGLPDNIIGILDGVEMDNECEDRIMDWMKADTKVFLMLAADVPQLSRLTRFCSVECFKDYVVYSNFK